ncbi:hypothetical protein L596_021983 [Steinernema carpocapsae]|uniref:Uncharacterized protein n=1 Tax=Steinernema carpocapsae TaxID=34508 RepID=A0A4U5MKG8_STECR|nr:hypothetical protein L596_021983 [Steinernema carpocapsae]
MHPAIKPALILVKVFGFVLAMSFVLIFIFDLNHCERSSEDHPMRAHEATLSKYALEYPDIYGQPNDSSYKILTVICVGLYLVACCSMLPWLCIRNRRIHGNVAKNATIKRLIIIGSVIFISVLLILLFGFIVNQGAFSLFWGYTLAKSFFCMNTKNVPEMLKTEIVVQDVGSDTKYICHATTHELHNFVFFGLYWFLVATVVYRTHELLSAIAFMKGVKFETSYKMLKFSFGNPTAKVEEPHEVVTDNDMVETV